MAFSFKCTRYSAIAQIVLGVLSIIFGIADRATIFKTYSVPAYALHTLSGVPIWMGLWFVITGIIGWFGSKRSYTSNGRGSRPLIHTYLGFSIVSVVFAGAIFSIYFTGILFFVTAANYSCHNRQQEYFDHVKRIKSLEEECKTSVALGSLIIIFALFEFGVGIWASVCCCCKRCCDCCEPSVQQPTEMSQVVYNKTQHGQAAYVVTQLGANGVPAMVPRTAAPQAYASATVGGAQGVGAQGGGAQGGVTCDARPYKANRSVTYV